MAAAVTAIVRGGRAFSGDATARGVDDMGQTQRDAAALPYRTVMMARACAPSRFGLVGPSYRRWT
jgi:hypothetical protein